MSSRITGLVVAIIVIMSPSVGAQTCPEPAGHWGYGPHDVAAWAGDIAVIASGPKLLVVDFRLAAPESIVGEVRLPGDPFTLAVEGDVAYAGVRRGHGRADLLVAIDLADPADPVPLGRLGIARAMSDVAVRGTVAYVTSRSEGLVIVDVADPSSPRRMSSLPTVVRPDSVVVRGEFAYLGGADGLVTVDVASPTDPEVTSILSITGTDPPLALSDHRLLAVSEDELLVLDLADPASPVRVGSVAPSGRPFALGVVGSTALVTQYDRDSGWSVAIIDTGVASDPREIGRYTLVGRPYHVAGSDGEMLVSMGTAGTLVVDVADPSAPRLSAELAPPARPGAIVDVAVDGNLAFLADSGGLFWSSPPFGWLRVIDLADGDGGREVSSIGFAEPAREVATFGELVVVLHGYPEIGPSFLEVVDVSDPHRPTVVGGLELDGTLWGELVVSGDHAYLTEGVLYVVDLSNPAEPVLAGLGPVPGGPGGALAVSDDRAYVAAGLGLCVVDVSDARSPVLLGCAPSDRGGRGVAVRDGVAFVSVATETPQPPWGDELRVFDVTDGSAPVEIGTLPLWGAAGRVSLDGDLLFVEVIGRGLLVVDVSDAAAPQPVGLAEHEASGTGADGRLYTASGVEGLDVLRTSSCLAAAPSPDFVWSPEEPTLGEEVRFTDISAGSPTSWSWEFGDGATSSEQRPRHRFTTPGQSTVTLRAGNQDGVGERQRWVPVQSIALPMGDSWIVPAAAHLDGMAGTRWRSDLVLTSTRDGADVVLYLMEQGEDNTLRHGVRVPLPRGATTLEDVVSTVFGADGASGAIFLTSDTGVWTSSRTFTLAPEGTFGQLVPPVFERGRHSSRELIQLTENAVFRTNLGIVNRLGTPLEVLARLHGTDGTVLAETTYDVEPYGHLQVDRFISRLTAAPVDDASVVLTGGPRSDFIAYASAVDNLTGDPSFMLPPSPAVEPLWIAAVAHVRGRNDTVWRTDLEVCATVVGDAEYRLELLESDRANPEPSSESFALGAGHCVRYADVVRTVFDAATTGSLRIVPVTGGVVASSRTFTRRPDGGTYGQHIPAALESSASVYHRSHRIHGVSQSSDPATGFRTNVGLVSAVPIPIEVQLEVRGSDGAPLEAFTVELRPFEHRQLNGVLEDIVPGDLVNASILVNSSTRDSRYFAYASVVDNASGDAVFIPAR